MQTNRYAVLFCILAVAARLTANPILVPPDLLPGDTYRLIFVTDATRDGTSSNIADYNAFVAAEVAGSPALFGLRTKWRALAATETVSAWANTGLDPNDTTTRFYNTRGELIVVGSPYAYASHQAAIFNAAGNPISTPVWTGSTNGDSHFFSLGIRSAISGYSNDLAAWSAGDARNVVVSLALYGLSDPLTVPASTDAPEPSSLFSGATAVLMALWVRRRRA